MGPEPGRGRGERRQPELRALLAIPACLAGKQGAQVACPELVGSPLHSPETQLAMAWGPRSALLPCSPHLFHPLPQPEWQHRLWPVLAPRAGGQWSILVPRVAGEPGEGPRGWGRGWGRVCWPFFSRLDGRGQWGGLFGTAGEVDF